MGDRKILSNDTFESNIQKFSIAFFAETIEEIITYNTEYLNGNKNLGKTEKSQSKLKIFENSIIPEITVKTYIKRLFHYTQMEYSTLLLANIYIDRFCEKNTFLIMPNNVFR